MKFNVIKLGIQVIMVTTTKDAKEFPLELKVPNQATIDAFNERHEKVTLDELRSMFKCYN